MIAAYLLTGCVGTAAGSHELYAEIVTTFVGQPLSEVKVPYWWLADAVRQPSEQKELPGGNVLYTYKTSNGNGTCDLFVELNPETQLIEKANAEGPGCLTPY